MHLSSYLKIFACPNSPGHLLIYSTRRCSVLRVSTQALQRIKEGSFTEAEQETLSRLGILIADPEAERREVVERFTKANRLSNRFHAIVLVTLDCNLACPYCFETGIAGSRSMSPATADLLVQMVERDHIAFGRQVALDLYGGEPLLRIDLITMIARQLRAACRHKGSSFSFNLVTNGTLLTREVAVELKGIGLNRVKVTLDGPRDVHDSSRPFASRSGSTFDVITTNIAAVCDVVDIHIGGNFTRHNYHDFIRLLDDLVALNISPNKLKGISFNPVVGRIGGGTPEFPCCSSSDESWLHEASLYLRRESLLRGFSVPKPRPAGCMVEFQNELVINVDGTIYKCPAFVGREGFAIGDLEHGVDPGHRQYNPDLWKRPRCLKCAYLPQCYGGCRFLGYVRNGNVNEPDCWKAFLDGTLEEYVRQDLTWRQ